MAMTTIDAARGKTLVYGRRRQRNKITGGFRQRLGSGSGQQCLGISSMAKRAMIPFYGKPRVIPFKQAVMVNDLHQAGSGDDVVSGG